MEEFRSVCRQLQSQLKKIPDCSETPFETEADALVDSWLDVRIWKTSIHMDLILFSYFRVLVNLCVCLAGVREDRRLHGQPARGSGVVGETAGSGWRSGQLDFY